MSGWRLLVLTLAACIAAGLFAVGPEDASACIALAPTLQEQAEFADLVVLGEVVGVHDVTHGGEKHTIWVAAALKGDPGQWLVTTPRTVCGDVVRFELGEHILLFLLPETNSVFSTRFDAVTVGRGYVIDDEGRFHRGYEGPRAPEDTLQQVAAITGASPDAVQAGVDFAEGRTVFEQPADANAALPWVGLGAAFGAALLLAGFVVARRVLLRR